MVRVPRRHIFRSLLGSKDATQGGNRLVDGLAYVLALDHLLVCEHKGPLSHLVLVGCMLDALLQLDPVLLLQDDAALHDAWPCSSPRDGADSLSD